MSQPTMHRYILEAETIEAHASDLGLRTSIQLARLPQGRFPIYSTVFENPLTALECVEFRLFVEQGAPTTSDDAYPKCT